MRSRSKRRVYIGLGLLWASGAPLGFLLLRWVLAGSVLEVRWLINEISSQRVTYAYLLVSTSIVFMCLGWWVGRRQDVALDLSRTDPLTNLPNRRQLFARIEEELRRTARYKTALSLLLIDVDGMKKINDSLGHRAGDVALCRVASVLASKSRSTDLPARTGGDEFAVLAPSARAQQARELAMRISRSLAALPADAETHVAGPTVSIGIADVDADHILRAEELYATADRALYKSKRARREGGAVDPAIEAVSEDKTASSAPAGIR